MKARPLNVNFFNPGPIVPVSSRDPSIDREQMILKHIPLVKYIAYRLAKHLPPHVSMEELCSAGVIGLMDALNKFDSGKKVQFKTYAEYRIRGAMLDEIRSQDWAPDSFRQKVSQLEKTVETLQKKKGEGVEDKEVAEELGLSLDTYYRIINEINDGFLVGLGKKRGTSDEDLPAQVAGKQENNPFDLLSQEEAKKIISQANEKLPMRERMVISLYYYEGLKLHEIAQILSLTQSRICQVHRKTILKLKVKLGNYFYDPKNCPKSSYNGERGKHLVCEPYRSN